MIHESVVIIGNCTISDKATILPYCVLENCVIEESCVIGPFTHIRPNSVIKAGAKIANFCEIKASTIGQNTKISHLSYVGDCTIGNNCNIGAGTIFCNYDGTNKHHTIVENNCFIGSNCCIVSPLTIGENSFIAAGSVLRKSIDKNSFYKSKMQEKLCKNNKIS